MFNLLPQKQKKNLRHEYRSRLIIVCLLFLATLGFIAFIAFMPSFLISFEKEQEVVNSIEMARKSNILNESDELNQQLTLVSLKIKDFTEVVSTTAIHEVFSKVLSYKTPDIRIRNLGYQKVGGLKESEKISIIGVAKDRDTLLNFVKNMENDESFSEINIPVSNFTKDKNLEFSIEVKSKI